MTRVIIIQDEQGKELERFKYNMPQIRSIEHWINGFWDFTPFNEALKGRIKFSDVDSQVEVDGHSLVFEFKASLFKMNRGQAMTAIRQARFQRTTTLLIEGGKDDPKNMVTVSETGVEGEFEISGIIPVDMEKIQKFIARWQKWALKNSMVKGNKNVEWEAVNDIMDSCFEVRG